MISAAELLASRRIQTRSTAIGRYYTTCPECSHKRQAGHQKLKCLGVTVDEKGVCWGCNHCGWVGGLSYDGKNLGSARRGSFRAPRNLSRDGRSVRDLYR